MKTFKYLLLAVLFIVLAVISLFWENDIPLEKLKLKYANENSQFLKIQGMDLHFREEGNLEDSIPLVLIHGTGASLHTWEPWVEKLKEHKRIVSMDLPAYGLTGPHPNGDYSIASYVSVIHELLQKRNINKCIIGGNSLGGLIAWQYAYKYPSEVEKLILVDAAGYSFRSASTPLAFRIAKIPVLKNLFLFVTPRSIVEGSVKNVFGDPTKVSEELIDRYFELSLRKGNRKAFVDRISSKLEFADNQIVSDKVKTLNIPTLLLWGEKDLLISTQAAEMFSKDLPNDTLVVLKNLGHVPMEEDPEESGKVVKAFLKL
jgi:pimeloyl-ACP methyl ester carboxylesterase